MLIERENVDFEDNLRDLVDSLNAVAREYQMPVIVSTHPRTKMRLEELDLQDLDPLVRYLKPLGFFDYNKLQLEAKCCISDSGTITEESSIMNFPAITIRKAHERPEGMDEGVLIMSGLKPDGVLRAIKVVVDQAAGGERPFRLVDDYSPDNFSKKVTRIVLSYTDYVNRTVWKKSL